MLGFLKNVLGGGAGSGEPDAADPVEHDSFTIVATPRKAASGGWSTEGRIGKVVDGEAKEVHFIRADTSTSREAAISLSVSKARKIIEEQGERIFRGARA